MDLLSLGWSIWHDDIWILLYVKLIGCKSVAWIDAWLEGLSAIGICALCYRWNLFGVMVLHRSMLTWRRGWGQSAIDICAFFYICNWLSVMMLHRSMLIWGPSAMGICAFGNIWNLLGAKVLHGSLIDWGSICHGYMWILLYIKLIGCNSFAWIYAQLGGLSLMGICGSCYIWN